MQNKAKVLWIGDGGVATGFARVNHSIIDNLPEDTYEIHHLAVNYRGDPYDCEHKLYPASLGGDLLGMNRIGNFMDDINPDLVFILNDPWVLYRYLPHFNNHNAKVVTYFPVDAKPMQREWVQRIVRASTPVAYTEFGRDAFTEQVPDAEIKVIPHGIDSDTFYPMDMQEARAQLSGIPPDAFVILSANRNQPRKRLDLLMKGFALFVEGKPDNVRLYVHAGVEDAGWNIIKLAERYDIDHRLLLTSLKLSPQAYISDDRLNCVYNACNVGITNSMGEGWGLTAFEHGACRRAQIVPNSSGPKSIYPDGIVYKLPVSHEYTYPGILTNGKVTTPEAIAEAMEFYYQNPDVRETHANKLYEYITSDKFNWKNIGRQWHELFQEVLYSNNRFGLIE